MLQCDELVRCLLVYQDCWSGLARCSAAAESASQASLSVGRTTKRLFTQESSGASCPIHLRFSNHEGIVASIYDNCRALPEPHQGAVRFVAISDTHNQHALLNLPSGDVLLHLGDFTNTGTLEECADFCSFVEPLPFGHKILVPGNHDLTCDAEWYTKHWRTWHEAFQPPASVMEMLRAAGVTVLKGESTSVCGIKVFGCPAQPRQPKSRPPMAFGRTRGAELKASWALVPGDVELLLTHTPPEGILDNGTHSGCEELKKALTRLRPAVHAFGHVHAGYGVHKSKHTLFVNASSAVERRGEGGMLNSPVVFDILKRKD